ncbi:hypothetical protein QR77_12375 [Streptomyces sp. 150FB]|nr:hypothetical protein QR77_12375 [Streptomyces sp. 150FB]
MSRRDVLGRGVRVGMLMAGVPGGIWVTFAFGAGLAFMARGNAQAALTAFRDGGILLVGSTATGVLVGVFIGGGLALASQRAAVNSRAWELALVGALLAAVAFPAEILVVALGTNTGPLEMVATVLAWPVMTVVAAVHSADIAGRTRRHKWLWTARRRRQQQPSRPQA